MSWSRKAFSSSVGQKLIMSITGLFLISFLIVHLLGNLLLLQTEGTNFLAYAEFMKTNTFIKGMEWVLFAGFIAHIVYAAIITAQNKKARPEGYAYSNPSQNSSWFSRNMGLSGSIVLIFLIVHLNTFFIPHKVLHTATVDIYEETILAFNNPLYVAFYVLAMCLLGFHLNHGFQSAFQTLGLRHSKYTPLVKKLGTTYAIVVPAAFAFIPIYILLFR